MSEGTLQWEREAVLAGTDELVFSDRGSGLRAQHTLSEVVGPYPIGPWWVNRSHRAPLGYRIDIAFEPADLHAQALERSS